MERSESSPKPIRSPRIQDDSPTRPVPDEGDVSFDDLFEIGRIQEIQDAFAEATGVASIITNTDGVPITNPSNFSRLCETIIRKTEKGLENCHHSDAVLGQPNPDGPLMRPCLSGGLWNGGASICVGERHIANWLIGQVRNKDIDDERVIDYAREIGADEDEFRSALAEVPIMTTEQFADVCQALFLVAKQLSEIAYQNVQQARLIAQQEASEKELRRLRNMLSNTINSMPSMLVGVDKGGMVTQWNREAERATGVASADAQGQPLEKVFPQLGAELGKIRDSIMSREPQEGVRLAREVNGETKFWNVTVYPLIANGVDGAVIRIDDVTGRVRMQEMMIQSEKMLSVGGLAAGMAHEINNPLAGILQSMQVIQGRLRSGLDRNRAAAELCGTNLDAVEAYMEERGIPAMIEAVVESGKRAARIVDNMLSFSRKSESRFTPHDLTVLLDRTVELAQNDYDLKKKYDFRRIDVRREYAPGVPKVLGEATMLQQVMLNLLRNGAEAMTEAHAPAPRIVLRVLPDGEMARVEIEDNGPGLDEKTRRHVFDPFYTTKAVGEGTGLGLSVSYFIITENHRGTLTVESVPGQGTKFIIRLPIESSAL
jgi:PAS domain S-box-containing protein